jgi:hypothetical protein
VGQIFPNIFPNLFRGSVDFALERGKYSSLFCLWKISSVMCAGISSWTARIFSRGCDVRVVLESYQRFFVIIGHSLYRMCEATARSSIFS